jgi:pilus assembly protein CpaF
MAYKRILSMCQMSDTKISTQILLGMIVEAFPIMVFKKQLPDGTRRIMEIIEATGVENGEIQATSLFRYMFSQESGGHHIRVGAISDTLANNLLENGADPEQVKCYQTFEEEVASSPSNERRCDQ